MAEESKTNVDLAETITPILEATQKETEPTPSAEPPKKKRKMTEKQIAALEKGRKTRWQKKATKQVLPTDKNPPPPKEAPSESESSSSDESSKDPLSPPSLSGSEPTSSSEQSDSSADSRSTPDDEFTDDSNHSDSADSLSSVEIPTPKALRKQKSKLFKKHPYKDVEKRVDQYLANYRFL
jgi:hypothetical protein